VNGLRIPSNATLIAYVSDIRVMTTWAYSSPLIFILSSSSATLRLTASIPVLSDFSFYLTLIVSESNSSSTLLIKSSPEISIYFSVSIITRFCNSSSLFAITDMMCASSIYFGWFYTVCWAYCVLFWIRAIYLFFISSRILVTLESSVSIKDVNWSWFFTI
jgi:hypothetical protein